MSLRKLLGDALYERTVRFSTRNYGCPASQVIREALDQFLVEQECLAASPDFGGPVAPVIMADNVVPFSQPRRDLPKPNMLIDGIQYDLDRLEQLLAERIE